MEEFAQAFEQADVVYVMDIYPAGEAPIPGISGEAIVERIRAAGHPSVHWVDGNPDFPSQLHASLQEGDVLMTLGAGDVWKVGTNTLAAL